MAPSQEALLLRSLRSSERAFRDRFLAHALDGKHPDELRDTDEGRRTRYDLFATSHDTPSRLMRAIRKWKLDGHVRIIFGGWSASLSGGIMLW